MTASTTKAELYLQKAEQFEAMARGAQADTAKAAFRYLAWSYRQLSAYLSRSFLMNDTHTDGLSGPDSNGANPP